MKIAYISSGTIKSSISYRPLALGREFVKMGHEVYVFALKFDKYSKFKDENITEIDGVKIIRPLQLRLFSFEIGLIPYIISSIFLLYKLDPDIVHIYKSNPVTLSGMLPRLLRKTPVVFDTDDIDSEVMKAEKNSSLKIKLVQISEKIMTHYASGISVGSKYLQNLYSSQFKNKPIEHIPNGAEFENTDEINLKKISNERIVFIGNVNRTNILTPLFYALKELKNQKLLFKTIIIGDGKYLKYFKNLVKKLGISNEITFLGWIPQAELKKHVQVGDIGYCYMPNELTIKACSNMKVFQYMQFGAVPLVSDVGDLPLYAFDGKAGYIAKHSNIKSLIKTLVEIISNRGKKRGKIQFAIDNAKNKYKWSVLASRTEDLYKKII